MYLYLREGSLQNYRTLHDAAQLMKLISTLPNLTEFKMHQINPIIIDAIQELLQTHQKLTMMHFVPAAGNNDIAAYRKEVQDDWSIVCFTGDQVHFSGEFPEFRAILEREMGQ